MIKPVPLTHVPIPMGATSHTLYMFAFLSCIHKYSNTQHMHIHIEKIDNTYIDILWMCICVCMWVCQCACMLACGCTLLYNKSVSWMESWIISINNFYDPKEAFVFPWEMKESFDLFLCDGIVGKLLPSILG